MYEPYFGLRERPFDLAPNPRFLFLTPRQREALDTIRFGARTGGGLTVIIGEAGTGKTTLIHAALAGLHAQEVHAVLLSNPTLTRAEFYESLADAFGLSGQAAGSKARFLSELRGAVSDRAAAGRRTALILDEAQSLSYELLEEVRLLSNLETGPLTLLNVVLSGQQELAARLNEPQLRQLKQRVVLRCRLEPLNLAETAAYIAGRIRAAGGSPADVFTREAISGIFEYSGGLPRTVNVICENAMMGGFAAQAAPITRALIDEICRDFEIANVGAPPPAASIASDAGAAREESTDPEPADIRTPSRFGAAPLFSLVTRKRPFSFF